MRINTKSCKLLNTFAFICYNIELILRIKWAAHIAFLLTITSFLMITKLYDFKNNRFIKTIKYTTFYLISVILYTLIIIYG